MSDCTCGIFISWSEPNKLDISSTVPLVGTNCLILEGFIHYIFIPYQQHNYC
jgi:hypothetical protein